MREILFRGKRQENDVYGKVGEWVYGIPIQNKIGTFISFDKNPHYCYQDYYIELDEISKIDPKTVGQYTGLTDKNGKRIFEGDILKCCDDKIGFEFMAIAEFGNPNGTYSWGWQLKPISGDTFVNPDILLWLEMEETGAYAEIIGNIHDNPELIGGVEE